MIESVKPHLHDDRAADARGGSLLDRTILQNGTAHRVFHREGLRRASNRPQTSLIHLRPSVQQHEGLRFNWLGVVEGEQARGNMTTSGRACLRCAGRPPIL
jgi:hypothetical protein